MLKQYENRDFKLLQSWVTDAELLFQFAGTDFHYPITEQQLTVYKEKTLTGIFILDIMIIKLQHLAK